MVGKSISFRISQLKRLISRDWRDVAFFSMKMLLRTHVHLRDYLVSFTGPGSPETHRSAPISINEKYCTMQNPSNISEKGRGIYNSGYVKLLGINANIGWPPAWETEETGVWDKGASRSIRYYGKGIENDIKLIWELHRMQWLPCVAAHALEEEDEDLAYQVVETLHDYVSRHPRHRTIAWMEGMELALRSISIIESLGYISKFIDDDARIGRINTYLSYVAEWISSHLSRKWRLNNNHLLIELVGLAILGKYLAWHPKSQAWEKRALRLLAKELDKQIVDERNWEPTTSYHRFVLEGLLVLEHFDTSFPTEYTTEMRKIRFHVTGMLRTLLTMSGTDLRMPLVGDDDAAIVIPRGGAVDPMDNSDVIEFARSIGRDIPVDKDGIRYWDGIGMGVMNDEGWLVHGVAGAPTGPARQGSHRHVDMMSLAIYFKGMGVLLDSGTGTYFGSEEWRDYFRCELAHSGIRSSDGPWSIMADLFEVKSPALGVITNPGDDSMQMTSLHPTGGRPSRNVSVDRGDLVISDHLELSRPITTFVCPEGTNWREGGDSIVIENEFCRMTHSPRPDSIVIRDEFCTPESVELPPKECAVVSTGYGEYRRSVIFDLHHKQGTMSNTRIVIKELDRSV